MLYIFVYIYNGYSVTTITITTNMVPCESFQVSDLWVCVLHLLVRHLVLCLFVKSTKSVCCGDQSASIALPEVQ